MELYCCEHEHVTRALYDPVICEDPRVVMRLLEIENQYIVTENYFASVQKEVTPAMRKTCLSWLMEVTENERCENAVFPVAVNYFDRYLALESIEKDNFQLLACVCLKLATKLRQSIPLGSEKLSEYTDYTYTPQLIVAWEYKVLHKLHWNMSSVTAHDYFDTIIFRLPDHAKIEYLTAKHANTFEQLCILEFELTAWPPSHIAVACIGAAIRGLPDVENIWPQIKELPKILHELTYIEMDIINNCIHYMEAFIETYIKQAQQQDPPNSYDSSVNKYFFGKRSDSRVL